jgi:hypothetical protein
MNWLNRYLRNVNMPAEPMFNSRVYLLTVWQNNFQPDDDPMFYVPIDPGWNVVLHPVIEQIIEDW